MNLRIAFAHRQGIADLDIGSNCDRIQIGSNNGAVIAALNLASEAAS
jgi:hypothetical protein